MTRDTESPIANPASPEFVLVKVSGTHGDVEPALRLEVARYPATVAQYRAFLLDGGYENSEWWSAPGWSWRSLHGIAAPQYWDQPGYCDSEQPVTGICLWEADAYARYQQASLPNEAEWYAIASDGGRLRLPWGRADREPSPEHANLTFFGAFGESRRVSVNGSVRSASPGGVRDLIGNVGEWCLPGTSRELPPEASLAVLRGGATWHVPGVADSSFRDVVPVTVRDNQTGVRLVRRLPQQTTKELPVDLGWPAPPRRLGRRIRRPTAPFRQEGIPADLNEASWRLHVHGSLCNRYFSLAELKRDFPVTSVGGLFVCVCRWGERNRFTGVLVRDLLAACLPASSWPGLYLKQRSIAGPRGLVYETTVPLAAAVEHEALLAWAMDGEDLTPELGWPLRLIDFHRYGYKGVKALAELEVTNEMEGGWWEKACQYDIDGTLLPGTITVVGKEAMRLDIENPGRVAWEEPSFATRPKVARRVSPTAKRYRRHTFSSDDLDHTDFTGSRFKQCRFPSDVLGARFDRCTFTDCRMPGVSFKKAFANYATFTRVMLDDARFNAVELRGTRFSECHLKEAEFRDCKQMTEVRLIKNNMDKVRVVTSNLAGARITGCQLTASELGITCLDNASLLSTNLSGSVFHNVELKGSTWRGVNLSKALWSEVDCAGASFDDCRFYGMRGIRIVGRPRRERDIHCAADGEPDLKIDDIKLAPLMYELDRDDSLGRLMEVLNTRLVLLLGRFTVSSKQVLTKLHSAFRRAGYVPLIVDSRFSGPVSADDVVRAAALLARFVIVDVTDPRSVLWELPQILGLRAGPVMPIVAAGESEPVQFSWLRARAPHLLLPVYEYSSVTTLINDLGPAVIAPCERALSRLHRRIRKVTSEQKEEVD